MRAAESGGSVPEVTIASAFNDGWAPHFATCARSIAASRGRESVHFVVLRGPELSLSTTAMLEAYLRDLGLSLELRSPSEADLRGLPGAAIFSPLVWYRTLLPRLLPEHDKVLSLDADTLVLQSLAPLFGRDLGSSLLSAVSSAPGPSDYAQSGFAGLLPIKNYFNAGVMMLNLAAMREARTGPKAIALGIEKGDQLFFAEQDALNHLARDNWDMLHPKWNAMSYLWLAPHYADNAYLPVERATARASPAVVHFEGGVMIKPWYYRSIHPLRSLYREYRATTPWPLRELENVSIQGAVLRRMPFGWQYALSRYKRAMTVARARIWQ